LGWGVKGKGIGLGIDEPSSGKNIYTVCEGISDAAVQGKSRKGRGKES